MTAARMYWLYCVLFFAWFAEMIFLAQWMESS